MTEPLDDLVRLLDLEDVEVDIFRGTQPEVGRQRVFGGQVAAQALMAAGRTVTHGRVHSLHSYFLRPGDPEVPIVYEVDRIRDGRSFTTRRVVAIQHGRAIFTLSTSFHDQEPGFEHQFPMPEAPDPEQLPTLMARLEPLKEQLEGWLGPLSEQLQRWLARLPIDQRHIGELPWLRSEPEPPYQRLWMRADGTLGNDPLLHACVAAYASDLSLFDTILRPHPVRWGDESFMGASVDHCMWFHRPFRVDEWLLFDTDSPAASGARGLARGFLFDRAGNLVVSMVQEGLARVRRRTAATGAAQPTPAPRSDIGT